MNIGAPQRIFRVEPAALPLPEVLPEPEPILEPAPEPILEPEPVPEQAEPD